MDPDAVYAKLQLTLTRWDERPMGLSDKEAAEDIIEAFDQLDCWIAGGGLLPQAWRKERLV